MSHDLVTVGEAMLRLSVPPGSRLEDSPTLDVTVAGAEANVAIAAVRMGRSAAWLSRLPVSPLGRRAAREIAGHGVDISHVRWTEDQRMGTYFVELAPAPRATTVIYDRTDSAASAMSRDDVAWDEVEQAGVVHISGITPALSDSCRDLALEVVERARTCVLDINYRARLWSADAAKATLSDLAKGADVVIVTDEDAGDVFGIRGDANRVLEGMRETVGGGTVILTRGAEGAAWLTDDGHGSAPSFPADVVDRIGAGDAFAAGVAIGVLDRDIPSGVVRGLAMAALKLGMYGDQLRVEPSEVEALIAGEGREVIR
ncbi:MAG: PfkB family carbohydrate kinase [Acidimicrobiia bacterium]